MRGWGDHSTKDFNGVLNNKDLKTRKNIRNQKFIKGNWWQTFLAGQNKINHLTGYLAEVHIHKILI